MGEKRVAWCTPLPSKGAGGFRTIIQNARALESIGFVSDLYFIPDQSFPTTDSQVSKWLNEWYGYEPHRVYSNCTHFVGTYDLAIATAWNTASFIADQHCNRKAYFVQDYEPLFFPIGANYLEAQASYSFGLTPITIGKWLAAECKKVCHAEPFVTDFCADLSVYHKLNDVNKENAICAICQPEKPRRASSLLLEALSIVKEMLPDLTIYLYGSEQPLPNGLPFFNLGILPVDQCNRLYNSCLCGISMSTSNPSRIPFEMMASGLPVVDLLLPNNLFDLPEAAVRLAKPDATSLASEIIQLISDEQLLSQMSNAGPLFMRNRDIEREGLQFIKACTSILSNQPAPSFNSQVIYNVAPSPADKNVSKVAQYMRARAREQLAHQAAPFTCHSNQLSVSITGFSEQPAELKVAYWSSPLQEDIIWKDLANTDELWRCSICFPSIDSSTSTYHFHFYIKQNENSELKFLASFDKLLVFAMDSSNVEDSTPEKCKMNLSGTTDQLNCMLTSPHPHLDQKKTLGETTLCNASNQNMRLFARMRRAVDNLFFSKG